MGKIFKKFAALAVVACLSLVTLQAAFAVTIEERVSSDNDDAEERVSNGSMYRDSSDLELVSDGSDQVVGIRFRYVQIPQGATITNAYIEFEVDETSSGATNLIFHGEARDWPQAFSSANGDISNRPLTSASAAWNSVGAWNSVNEKHQSTDLKSIVQEIVDRDGWSMGNPMVFIISGSGERVAESHDGEKDSAPLLHVEFSPKANNLDLRIDSIQDDAEEAGSGSMSLNSTDLEMVTESTDQKIGLRFTGVELDPGVTISKAYIDFATDEVSNTNPGGNNLVIKGQDASFASTFTSSQHNITDRPDTASAVDWSNIPKWELVGEKHRSPDISTIVQEIIGRADWSSGNPIAFIISGEGKRVAESYDGDSEAAPLLHIEYGGADAPYITVDVASSEELSVGAASYEGTNATEDSFTISNSGTGLLNYTISDDAGWLSLSPTSGSLTAGASVSVAITFSNDALAVGTHEATISVTGAGANNSPVEIPVSLTVQEIPEINTCGDLPPYLGNQVSPAVLIELDVSSSMNSMMPISTAADRPHTPDLKSIVQELVNRDNWASGNAMAFIIEGSGKRVADSYDGNSGTAPLLHVEYEVDEGAQSTIDVRVRQDSDDAEDGSGSTNLSSSDLELIKDGSDQVVGIRFEDLTIPAGATINSAYIEFTIDEATSETTNLTIYGQAHDNPSTFTTADGSVTGRSKTTASVAWSNISAWSAPTEMSRVAIGKAAISDLVKDRTIDWGYGTWAFSGYDENNDFTKIHVGTKSHTDDQQTALQSAISSTNTTSGTPFGPSIVAARKYFDGEKKDQDGAGDFFVDIGCQDKFLIDVTDGLGYAPHTTVDLVESYTQSLCDAGVTPIAVGFGIDDATQLFKMAEIANACGNLDDDDNLFALHDEIDGVAQPFIASSKEELVEALSSISKKISNRFTGSAPAPTTSADDQDQTIVLLAEFKSADWSGDLKAYGKSSAGVYDELIWSASEEMPVAGSRNVRTVDINGDSVIYDDALLNGDNWLCKPLGDIIKSTPKIIKKPPYYYNFDNYHSFYTAKANRDPMVYVGANDGALHAFSLNDTTSGGTTISAGTESWAFVPPSLLPRLDKALADPTFDQCSDDYCHQYYVNGNPIAADIYAGGAWKTILVTGLREGGESYFALDVTSGLPMGAVGGASFMWEFTDPDLGQSWADPEIDRVHSGAGYSWATFLTSGYSSGDRSLDKAYLFGLRANDMAPLWKDASNNSISKWKLSDKLANALSAPISVDLDGYDAAVNHIYAGDLYGSLYRVGNIGEDQTPVTSKLLDLGNLTQVNPIRAKPKFAYTKTYQSIWLYAGTGRYEDFTDKANNSRQYLFGLQESPANDGTYSRSYVVTPTEINAVNVNPAIENPVSGTNLDEPLVALQVEVVTDLTTGKKFRIIEGRNDMKKPWVIRLAPASGTDGAERITSPPIVDSGVVFFTTFVPNSDVCSGSGTSYVYAVEYNTGLPGNMPIIDINEDGYVDTNDKINLAGDADNDGDENDNDVDVAGVTIGEGEGRIVTQGSELFASTDKEGLKVLQINPQNKRAKVRGWRDSSF